MVTKLLKGREDLHVYGIDEDEEASEVLQFYACGSDAGSRLDHFLVRCLPERTRSLIQDWIEGGMVMVGGLPSKSSFRLKPGQEILVEVPPLEPADPEPEAGIPLDVLFEDEHILVLNKQKGLVIHPAAANRTGTLVNALLHHCHDLSGIRGVEKPGIVHRLDKDTTGVMVVAKNDAAHLGLTTQFSDRAVLKIYEAIVHGQPNPGRGRIQQSIARHTVDRIRMAVNPRGKTAITEYDTLERWEFHAQTFSRVEMQLLTGRTHQIRVHLAWLGCPLVGDPVYTKRSNPFGLVGQALHCKRLGFSHPVSHVPLEFSVAPPADYSSILEMLRADVVGREP